MSQSSSHINDKCAKISWSHNLRLRAFQERAPTSPLAGRREWAALRSCYSVVCHESQRAHVCSNPRPNLHTPTINLLPGNPLPLTCVRVCLCATLCICDVTSSPSGTGMERAKQKHEDRTVWAGIERIEDGKCQRLISLFMFGD